MRRLMVACLMSGVAIALVGCGGGTAQTVGQRIAGSSVADFQVVYGAGGFELYAHPADTENNVSNSDVTTDGGDNWHRNYQNVAFTVLSTDTEGNDIGAIIDVTYAAPSDPAGETNAGDTAQIAIWFVDCEDDRMGTLASPNLTNCSVFCVPDPEATEICPAEQQFAAAGLCSDDATDMTACSGFDADFNAERQIRGADEGDFLAATVETP